MANNKVVKIWDATAIYYARMNINESIQHNRPTSSQTTMNSKYPFHIHNGEPSYFSGSCTATFVDNNGCYVTSESDVASFNYKIAEWLHNDRVKYLQYSNSTVFPVGILDTVKIDTKDTVDNKYDTTVTFDWEQIGTAFTI